MRWAALWLSVPHAELAFGSGGFAQRLVEGRPPVCATPAASPADAAAAVTQRLERAGRLFALCCLARCPRCADFAACCICERLPACWARSSIAAGFPSADASFPDLLQRRGERVGSCGSCRSARAERALSPDLTCWFHSAVLARQLTRFLVRLPESPRAARGTAPGSAPALRAAPSGPLQVLQRVLSSLASRS